ncbi:MAG: hypothetical protein HOW97_17080 [Catenulispora sp.]|nr:hypothetical protein [Catenulispora sp.]
MAGMGPPPKPAAQRRRTNATVAMTRLPSEGRKGEPPEWPMRTHAGYDDNLWAELWSTPQAVAWERLGAGTIRVVARYVVLLAEADVGEPKAAMEVRQIEDRLGLSPLAMLRLRWEIAPDEVAEQRDQRTAAKAQTDVRARLRIVDSASGQ